MADHGRGSYEERRDGDHRDENGNRQVILALTPEEFAQLRTMLASWPRMEKMIAAHEFTEKFWGHVGRSVKWIAATSAAVIALRLMANDFKDILKGWLK